MKSPDKKDRGLFFYYTILYMILYYFNCNYDKMFQTSVLSIFKSLIAAQIVYKLITSESRTMLTDLGFPTAA